MIRRSRSTAALTGLPPIAPSQLTPDDSWRPARMFVELGAGQEAAVRDLFTNVGLIAGIARTDLAGIPRVLGAGFVP